MTYKDIQLDIIGDDKEVALVRLWQDDDADAGAGGLLARLRVADDPQIGRARVEAPYREHRQRDQHDQRHVQRGPLLPGPARKATARWMVHCLVPE